MLESWLSREASIDGGVDLKLNRNLIRPLNLALVGLLVIGCSTTDVVVYDRTVRSPKVESEVEVLLEPPDRPHSVIARIQFGPDAFVDDYQSQTNQVVRGAAELGADAVIISYDSEVVGYTSGNATTGVYGSTSESKVTVGLAIVYNEPDGGS